MTQAVCFNCGEFKIGSFTECPECGVKPKEDEDIAISLVFTDFYSTLDELGNYAEMIKNGEKLVLSKEHMKDMLETIAEVKNEFTEIKLGA